MATASDNFNRANETPLAGNWTDYSQALGQFNLSGNAVVPSNLGVDQESYWNANSFGNDQFSEAAITVTGTVGGDQGLGVSVRTNGVFSTRTQYRLVADHAASSNMGLSKFVSGTHTSLSSFTQAFTNGDTLRLEASGTGLTVKLNGTTVQTATDSSVTSGRVGISYSSTETSASLDNWQGGDLAAAVAPSPAPFRPLLPTLNRFRRLNLPPLAFPVPAASVSGAATLPQQLTADTVSVSATMVRQTGKIASATSAVTASMARQVGKVATATSSVTATLAKQVGKTLTATTVAVTASMTAIKVILRTLTATVVVTGSMVRQIGKPLTATTVAVTATLLKQVNKNVAATAVAVTATLAGIKVILKTLTATTVTVTGTMVRQVAKPLTVTVALSSSLVKQVAKTLRATNVAVTATMAAIRVFLRTLTATAVVVTGSISRRTQKTLAATATATASVAKLITGRLTATVAATASLVASFVAQAAAVVAARLGITDTTTVATSVTDTQTVSLAVAEAQTGVAAVVESPGATVAAQDVSGADVTVADLAP